MSITDFAVASDPAVRRSGIGGSDIAPIAGFGIGGKTGLDVYLEKIGAKESDDIGEAGYWGQILEEPVAQEAARRGGFRIARVNQTRRHREHSFLMAHFDRRIIGRPRWMLEVKTTNVFAARDAWDDVENLPFAVQLQVQTYCEVGDLDGVLVAVLIGGQELRPFEVLRDREIGAHIVRLASAFWNEHVIPRVPPVPRTIEEARMLFPESQRLAIEANADAARTCERYRLLKRVEKRLSEKIEAAQLDLATFLGERDTLTIGGSPALTWRSQTSRRFNDGAFKVDHPDLHAQYLRETTSRPFRLKGIS